MVFLTGGIHGDVRQALWAIQRYEITKNDILILLGDVGLNYYGNDHGDKKRKKLLNKAGVPILCIHGNHEARPASIPTYHEDVWHGGIVYVEDAFPNILFAKDGSLFDLEGKKAIALGGAYSVDKFYRLSHGINWFPDEQPSYEIKKEAKKRWMVFSGRLMSSYRILARKSTRRLRLLCPDWISRWLIKAQKSGWTGLKIAWIIKHGTATTGISISELIGCIF